MPDSPINEEEARKASAKKALPDVEKLIAKHGVDCVYDTVNLYLDIERKKAKIKELEEQTEKLKKEIT